MNKPLVYLIDDDAEITQILERRFLKFGCDARSFTDPAALYKAFDEKKPKLLLVDLNLGDGLSGFDIIKRIRADFDAELPILILSGDRDLKNIAHGLEIGAHDYIIKPPLRLDFEEIIYQYLTADHLPSPTAGTLQPSNPDKKNSKLVFRVSIEELNPTGITILSDHLIKKGASFHLKGPELKSITPGCDRIFVTVIASAAKIVSEQKKYQIQLEVDASQTQALKEIKDFLSSRSQ